MGTRFDTWTNRDLPVLRGVVELYEEDGRGRRATTIASRTGFDNDTVQRALRALYTEPYFDKGSGSWGGELVMVGTPTSEALRGAGQSSPEAQIDRLIAALEAASDETTVELDDGWAPVQN